MTPIINAADIRAVRDLSLQIKDQKINPIISDAQISDLRPLLGDALYYDVLKKFAAGGVHIYNDLIDGSEYIVNDITYTQYGLKRLVCELAYVRYMFDSSDVSTPFGLMDKNFTDGQKTSRDRSKELSNMRKQTTNDYWLGVEHYLRNNTDTIPLYKRNNQNNISTFKIINITR